MLLSRDDVRYNRNPALSKLHIIQITHSKTSEWRRSSRRCSIKKLFLKALQNSQEYNFPRVSLCLEVHFFTSTEVQILYHLEQVLAIWQNCENLIITYVVFLFFLTFFFLRFPFFEKMVFDHSLYIYFIFLKAPEYLAVV